LLYLDYLVGRGVELFEATQALDLEGIVAKPKGSSYVELTWLKIRNPAYSQVAGRHELFKSR
jgi:ATP-dependent DNA ligase